MNKIEQLKKLTVNTPLIKIRYSYLGSVFCVYAKLENFSLTGSIKDRVAVSLLENAINNGQLKDDQPIVEVTSGNMGISLSAIGAYLKHKVYIIMPTGLSKERYKLVKLYSGNIILGGKDFASCFKIAKKIASKQNAYMPSQFENMSNIMSHYTKTASEILEFLIPDAIVSGVGTGGTLMGLAKHFKELNKTIKVIAIEPTSAQLLKNKNSAGKHSIQGISDGFIPKLYDENLVDDIIDITSKDAIYMAQQLSSQLGLSVGISGGANFLGCVIANEKYNLKKCVTVFADGNKKYLSTELTKKVNIHKLKVSNKIKLIDYEVLSK